MADGYYVQLFSPHGLIRYRDPEFGRDKDTGGQVKYVLELLDNLSQHPGIRKVDLFTRRIADKRVSSAYSKEIEVVNEKARIIRITCGGLTYRAKETLWDHLEEFVDKTIRFIEGENDFPDLAHGHYADGNYLAHQISEILGVPFLATGHSLGRNKKNLLLQQGMTEAKINENFNMDKRIAVEEHILQSADMFVVSTQHIVESQYALYENFNAAKFKVIPPGINSELFYPFYRFNMPSFTMSVEQEQAVHRINSDIDRFLFNPAKPLILSIGRADKRKNFETIIQSFGQDKELQAMANLAIFAGVRKDISLMPADEKDILTNLLLQLDKYDLYGKMAIPKKNDPKLDIPEIYRMAARKKGVYINATHGENFGLTIVESAACGLPVVASRSGGPKEIIEQCGNGLLVDIDNPDEILSALKQILSDQVIWNQFSNNGIVSAAQKYSWSTFSNKYVELIHSLFDEKNMLSLKYVHKSAYGKMLTNAELFLITDLDGTLVEGKDTDGLDVLRDWIMENRGRVVFGVASGRNLEITKSAIEHYGIPSPDIVICSVGSEMYYTDRLIPDLGWESHIDYQWKRGELQEELTGFPGIRLQEEAAQWRFKLSYYVDETFNDDRVADLYKFLDDRKLHARIAITDNKFLDLLPQRAGKGNAVKYLSYKWKIPLNQIITAGNGGNDIDMLTVKTKSIVVANHSPELADLQGAKSIYFSKAPLSRGVMEGIEHYLSLN